MNIPYSEIGKLGYIEANRMMHLHISLSKKPKSKDEPEWCIIDQTAAKKIMGL